MLRSFAVLAALAIAAPAVAASYVGKPAAAPAEKRILARDIVWTCGADSCRGSSQESRPQVLCQSLAKRAGRLASFAVDGREFAPDDLAKCNTAAPGQAD